MSGILLPLLIIICVSMGLGQADPKKEGTSRISEDSPIRVVTGNKITSPRMPKVSIEFRGNMKYVGGQAFDFSGTVHAEQHFFVDADKNGVIKRMYWIQFEGFLPGINDAYDYKTTEMQSIGKLEFLVDTRIRPAGITPSPESDAGRGISFLGNKGFRFADENIRARFIHLTDETKRNEMLIIYQENLALSGLRAADIQNGGAQAGKWKAMSTALIARARNRISLK